MFVIPVFLFSQSIKKNYFKILDEYIEHEIISNRNKLDKSKIIVSTTVQEIDNELMFSFSIFPLGAYNSGCIRLYKGIRFQTKFPERFRKKLNKRFEIDHTEIFIQKIDLPREIAPLTVQFNSKNEIYFIGGRKHYLEKFKKLNLKFSKDFISPLQPARAF